MNNRLRYWFSLIAMAFLAVIHYPPNDAIRNKFNVVGPPSPQAAAQVAYAFKHYAEPNVDGFGYLGSVDCANFVSQTLIARGWSMDDYWWHDPEAYEGYGYSRAWVSSTALNEYLGTRPDIATPLRSSQEHSVEVGDLVMFDWDASGDRDHTAIVSGIKVGNGTRELLLAAHSEGMYNYPLSHELFNNPDQTKVFFWKIHDKPAKTLIPAPTSQDSYAIHSNHQSFLKPKFSRLLHPGYSSGPIFWALLDVSGLEANNLMSGNWRG